MNTEVIRYTVDGVEMLSVLHWDAERIRKEGPQPGVLVFPHGTGLDHHAKGRAARLVRAGYVALACDLHGNGKVMESIGVAMELLIALRQEPARLRARTRAHYDALRARPEVDAKRVGAIGFCFGGMQAIELARSGADLAAAVAFHGSLGTANPDDAKNIRGKILACVGADDPAIPPEQRAAFEKEMREANVDWQLHVYGGVVHAFTNEDAEAMGAPERARYDERATGRSWAAMQGLFDEVF